jgi:hypothetical protein
MLFPFKIVSAIISLLLLVLAVLLPWSGWFGPIPPSPDKVLVSVNEEDIRNLEQPVQVQKGELIQVRVQVSHRGQPIDPGEFTYQWCFDPPINSNLHSLHCLNNNYRAEANSDYKPETSQEQKLRIIIRHDFLRTLELVLLFKPE